MSGHRGGGYHATDRDGYLRDPLALTESELDCKYEGHAGAFKFKLGTRGELAATRETNLFSLGLDHHHVVVNVLISTIFVLAHALFITGTCLDGDRLPCAS